MSNYTRLILLFILQNFYYTPAPQRGMGVYCFTSVRLSIRPSVHPRYFSSHFYTVL